MKKLSIILSMVAVGFNSYAAVTLIGVVSQPASRAGYFISGDKSYCFGSCKDDRIADPMISILKKAGCSDGLPGSSLDDNDCNIQVNLKPNSNVITKIINARKSSITNINDLPTQELLNKGTAAFQNYDYVTAKKLLLIAANRGDNVAQLGLGLLYWTLGDYSQAKPWLIKSANHGNGTAQNLLGTMYLEGKGVKVDKDTANKWFLKSANQGNAQAQFNLSGILIEKGIRYKKNGDNDNFMKYTKHGLSWLLKSANQGNVDAQIAAGGFSESLSDNKTACLWYDKAAKQNNNDAINKLHTLSCDQF